MGKTVTISGSFQKSIDDIRKDIKTFERLGCSVLSPRMFKSHVNDDGFVILDSDGGRRPAAIHGRHLHSINQSTFLWVRISEGYVGLSTALEIGYAESIGIPIYASEQASDNSINRFLEVTENPEKAFERAQHNNHRGISRSQQEESAQKAVAKMSAECGFDKETDQEILKLLDEEVAELKEAVANELWDPSTKHSVAEEMADCAIYLYHLANQSGIDLDGSIHRKIKVNLLRWGRKRESA